MNLIVYVLQVSACVGFFYALYYVILRKLTFFTINRWYLLAALVFSFMIPLLTITVRYEYVQDTIYFNQFQQLPAQLQGGHESEAFVQPQTNWFLILTVAYLTVASALFIRMATIVYVFLRKTKRKNSTKIGHMRLIRGNERIGNGSFLNYIFLKDEKLERAEVQQIIQHEMLHVRLLHSVDRILLEFSKIILWFNPFIYLYARAVEENHEYEVDYEIGQLSDKNKYADLLLKLSTERRRTVYHAFSMMPLEKRITMLFNQPTKSMKKIIYVLVLPVGVLSCLAFANLKTEKKSTELMQTGTHLATDINEKAIANGNSDAAYRPAAGWAAQTAAAPFFSRRKIRNKNGKNFDKVTFTLADGAASADLGPDDKLGAFIDGTFYNEYEIRKIPVEKTAALTFDRSKAALKADKIPNDNYAVPFCFKTKAKK